MKTRRHFLAVLAFLLLVGLGPGGSRPSVVDARGPAPAAGLAGTEDVLLAGPEVSRPYVGLVPGEAVTVAITTGGFNPDLLFIVAGTDVTWHNETGAAVVLNVFIPNGEPSPSGTTAFLPMVFKGSAAGERAAGDAEVQRVAGELLFSAEIPAGGSYTYTFATSGLFDYSLAGKPLWQGRVVVDPVSGDNPNEVRPLDELVSWIYSGPNAVQTGVAPGTIDPQRLAVVRGLVVDGSGAPVPGTRVSLLDRPELGYSTTRSDGSFDMVINGGGPIVLDYRADGYLPVQRTVARTPWLDYVPADTVVLTPLDTAVTTIDLGSISTFAVARGSVQSDDDGTRQATLLFPAGTTARIVGRSPEEALSTVSVRATEYTVGALGASAMPGNLPPNSGYTYAVEFSIDEAGGPGAEITFSQPLINYTENLIDAPVGSPVPTGYYDREAGAWVPAENGLVIAIIAESGGMAQVDITGDGVADDAAALAAVGINDAERQQLAGLYNPGQELWRVKIAHFSPWDHNWPYGPPPQPLPQPPDYTPWPQEPQPCTVGGSIISCETQNLSEAIPIAGTPYHLVYNSDRSAGWKVGQLTEIELLAGAVPPVDKLIGIRLSIEVAGRRWEYFWEHPALGNADVPDITPNLTFPFQWDGRDVYGNEVSGRVNAIISVGYGYPMVYYEADDDFQASFGAFGDVTVQWPGRSTCMAGLAAAENPVDFLSTCTPYFTTTSVRPLQMWTAGETVALGGWTFSAQHFYDPVGKVLYYGSGGTAPVEALGDAVRTVAMPDETDYMVDFALGRDGSYYLLDIANGGNAVFRQDPAGNVTQIGGNGMTNDPTGDGGLATEAVLGNTLIGLALGPDGSVYFGTTDIAGHGFIRKIDPAGIITTVAGSHDWTGTIHIEDGYPATETHFGQFVDTAVAADGSIYFSEWGTTFGTWPRIRRIRPDGIVQTVAGKKSTVLGDEDLAGVPAMDAVIGRAYGLTIAPDGTLYYADPVKMTVNRIGTDGILTRVAGIRNVNAISGDGGAALYAAVGRAVNLALAEDGTLFIRQDAPFGNVTVLRQVATDGNIYPLAGLGDCYYSMREGEAPNSTCIMTHDLGLTAGPDGQVYFGDGRYRVRRIEPALPGYGTGDIFVPSGDGSEVYHFSRQGRHLNTFDAANGVLRTHLSYDEGGLLVAVTDGDGNQTQIERQNGAPVAVVAPWGQRTPVARNGDGLLSSVTNPAGEAFGLTYQAGGLLATFTEPGGGVHRYSYDADGRLVRDEAPDGFVQTLSRVQAQDALTVTVRTGAGLETVYASHVLPTGLSLRTIGHPDGTRTRYEENADGTVTILRPDGTRLTMIYGPDPRWGMGAPIISWLQVETPGGQGTVTKASRSVTLADPANPLSVVTSGESVEVMALGESYGERWDTTYSAAQGTYTLTSPEYRHARAQMDARGRVIATQEADFLPLTYSYDSHGRVVRIAQGEGSDERVVSLTYDSAGFVGSVTDALGATTTFGYDAVGRLLTERRPDGALIGYSYNANGNATAVTPPGRDAYSFTYGPAGALLRYVMPAMGQGGEKSYSYDADGRLLEATDADGQKLSLAYDGGGRLVSMTMPGASVGYGFDPVTGQPQSVSRTGGAQFGLTFDGYLLTRRQWSGPVSGVVDWSYDSLLRVAAIEVNDSGPIGYTRDDDGLIVGVGPLTLQRHWDSTRPIGASVGTLSESWSYNDFGELEAYTAAGGSGTIYSVSYTRDPLGRLVTESHTVGGTTTAIGYGYDSLGRLTRVTQNGAEVERYTYDANGNRLTATVRGTSAAGVYDARDRLTSYGGSTFTYQPSGELQTRVTAAGTTTYQYDLRGSLTAVGLANGSQINYVLDGTGRRVQRKLNGTATQGLLYQDGLHPVAELDGTGAVRSRFVYATRGNVPDLMLRGGKTYRIISDYRGSPVLVVDVETGDVAQQLRYDAFGNVLQDTNPGFQPFGFAGGLYDPATGLVRFGARDYDAAIGRWTAPDPLLFAPGPTNLYSYIDNDPVNYIDPWGLEETTGNWWTTLKEWLGVAEDVHDKINTAKELVESYDNRDDPLNPRDFKPPHPNDEVKKLQEQAQKTAEEGVDPFSKTLQRPWWQVIDLTRSSPKPEEKGDSSHNNNRNPPGDASPPCPPNRPPLPKNPYYGQY